MSKTQNNNILNKYKQKSTENENDNKAAVSKSDIAVGQQQLRTVQRNFKVSDKQNRQKMATISQISEITELGNQCRKLLMLNNRRKKMKL